MLQGGGSIWTENSKSVAFLAHLLANDHCDCVIFLDFMEHRSENQREVQTSDFIVCCHHANRPVLTCLLSAPPPNNNKQNHCGKCSCHHANRPVLTSMLNT